MSNLMKQHEQPSWATMLNSLQRFAVLPALREYIALHLVSRPRVALWAALNMMELVVRCWERAKPVRLNHIMLMLERHLRLHLAA